MGKSRRQEDREAAARLTKAAKEQAENARALTAKAEAVKRRDRNARWPDPAATRAIVRDRDSNRRIAEANAKDLRSMAAEAERASRRWF